MAGVLVSFLALLAFTALLLARLRWAALPIAGAAIVVAAACGGGDEASTFDNGANAGSGYGGTGLILYTDSGTHAGAFGDGSAEASLGGLVVSPPGPVIVVTVVDGAVTSTSVKGAAGQTVTFAASRIDTGETVPALWVLDRGELGSIAADSGLFTAKGVYAGVGHVTASYGGLSGTTAVTVVINSANNGPLAGTDPGKDSDFGGVGGVGGVPFGLPVDPTTLARLTLAGADASTAKLALLYPYDKTVWPRGMLPPLLMWSSSVQAKAVLIHIKEDSYEFTGTYAGTNLQSQLIEEAPWKQATYANGGEPLVLEIKIDDGTTTYGPVTVSFTVSPSILQGTVYYNSYNTQVPTYDSGSAPKGAVLAIKPGARNPAIAIASTGDACHVCHTVSADGSTIVMQGPSVRSQDPPTLDRTQVFSLKDPGQPLIKYYPDTDATNVNKFDWAAVYPDGTMAVTHSGDGYHSWGGDSDLFKLSDGTKIASTGWTDVVRQATMPSFSPDGRHLAFTFFAGPGAGGVKASSSSHVLSVMDFDCGAPAGSVTCSGASYAFSNLRLLHQDDSHPLGWPSFLGDAKTVVFQKSIAPAQSGSALYTDGSAQAELWSALVPDASSTPQAVALANLNGDGYLPDVNANHNTDELLNYEPTVNPIASGGYYWVIFTSRRAYGNVLTGDAWQNEETNQPALYTKKLWVAAIDLYPEPGKDPSHPAFYLPGQELRAGNMRGYWVVDPCRADGASCDNGAECCNGYCSAVADGGLVCGSHPNGCAAEFDKCTLDSDCCDVATGVLCLNGRCTVDAPAVK